MNHLVISKVLLSCPAREISTSCHSAAGVRTVLSGASRDCPSSSSRYQTFFNFEDSDSGDDEGQPLHAYASDTVRTPATEWQLVEISRAGQVATRIPSI